MEHRRSRARTLLAAPLLLAGCLRPVADTPIRYYAVELPPSSPAATPSKHELRLRHLDASGHLRERIAIRKSPVAYEFLDLDRWTESPVGYVAVALDRALFESGAFLRTESSGAATLDVTLLAFEVRRGTQAEAVVVLAGELTDPDGHSMLDREVKARVPIAQLTPTNAARAIGDALQRAVAEFVNVLSSAPWPAEQQADK